MRTNNKGQTRLLKSILFFLAFLAAAGCKKNQAISDTAAETDKALPGLQTSVSSGLIVGVNGHPLNNIVYDGLSTIAGVDYTTQSNMLKAMNMSYYRIDIQTDATGTAVQESRLLDIIAKCQANNIKILPMISDKCSYADTATTTGNYQRAYTQMRGFATKYGQYFDYFELGNEWELFDKLLSQTGGNTHDGTQASDYDLPRVLLAEQYVKGMEAGLKSKLPGKQSMVNTAGFFPTYWMDRMLAAAPTINICAWHYYANMPGNLAAKGYTSNIHQYLYNRYHRPIWYTETNYIFKTTKTQQENENASNDWRVTLTAQAIADPNVKAIIFYELLDEPERSPVNEPHFEEENFGYVKFNNYPGKSDPTAFNTWKANPNRYQDWSYKRPAAELTDQSKTYQAEALAVESHSSGDVVRNFSDPAASGGAGSIIDANAVGDFVSYTIPTVAPGTYYVSVRVKRYPSRGIFQFRAGVSGSSSGSDIGAPYDEYKSTAEYVNVDLGNWVVGTSSAKYFKFTVTGANLSSADPYKYSLAFDYFTFTKITP
jgi:hypothetical protein